MVITFDVLAAIVAVAVCVPSAVVSFAFWLLKRHLDKKEKESSNKEAAKKQCEFMLIKGVGAAIALGEATAEAVARIPDAHCNGDMHEALEYARSVKHEQKDFLNQQGINAMF